MKLSHDQQHALNEIMGFLMDPDEHEMALSGAAGTGKTYLTQKILDEVGAQASMIQLLLNEKYEVNVLLASSTNKAAKVLADATNRDARTIHSILGLRVYDDFKTGKTVLKRSRESEVIENTLIIIDEAGMVNKQLLATIRELTLNCKVLYILDKYQLAPVFESDCPVIREIPKQVHLTTIQRQAANSPIISFSQQFVNAQDGHPFPVIQSHGTDIKHVDGNAFQKMIDLEFSNMFHDNQARALAWTNKRVHQLNSYIRHSIGRPAEYEVGEHLLTNNPILGPKGNILFRTDDIAEITKIEPGDFMDVHGWIIELDNRIDVFQAFNQHEVVAAIKAASKDKNWPLYFSLKNEFGDLRPIFSCTANKAQGSTYDTVFIDLDDFAKCRKNTDIMRMLYTSITRAKNQVIMTGALPTRLYE